MNGKEEEKVEENVKTTEHQILDSSKEIGTIEVAKKESAEE